MATFTVSAAALPGYRWKEGNVWKSSFTVAGTGTYTSGGDTLDLSVVQATGIGRPPLDVKIEGTGTFLYRYVSSTTAANGKITVWTNSAGGADSPLAEHSAAALAAGVTSDTIKGIATWGFAV